MNAIVAVDENWAIGKDGDQLVYLKADLQNFKRLTLGHPVILGRKTLATFPGGRPLPGRRNLVLSRDPDFHPEGVEVFRDMESLLSAAPEDSFVIGGGSVYEALLPYCDLAFVTKLEGTWEADTWFPDLDTSSDWQVRDRAEPLEEKGIRFQYVTYERVK
jgi:dihydrofolate reductase